MNQSILIIVFLVCGLFIACGEQGKEPAPTNQVIPAGTTVTAPAEHIEPTRQQAARREQSENYLKAKLVPIYPHPNALFVDSDEAVTIRNKEEVVDRALALLYVGLKSEGLSQPELDEFSKKYNAYSTLSPQEIEYVTAKNPTDQQRIDANWRYESLHVLLWALGYIDSLSYPDKVCNVAQDAGIIIRRPAKDFREHAKLRTKKEILDQADLALRIHWACVNARVNREPTPAGIDASVAYERHYSLNWLINYLELDWDEVSTDT